MADHPLSPEGSKFLLYTQYTPMACATYHNKKNIWYYFILDTDTKATVEIVNGVKKLKHCQFRYINVYEDHNLINLCDFLTWFLSSHEEYRKQGMFSIFKSFLNYHLKKNSHPLLRDPLRHFYHICPTHFDLDSLDSSDPDTQSLSTCCGKRNEFDTWFVNPTTMISMFQSLQEYIPSYQRESDKLLEAKKTLANLCDTFIKSNIIDKIISICDKTYDQTTDRLINEIQYILTNILGNCHAMNQVLCNYLGKLDKYELERKIDYDGLNEEQIQQLYSSNALCEENVNKELEKYQLLCALHKLICNNEKREDCTDMYGRIKYTEEEYGKQIRLIMEDLLGCCESLKNLVKDQDVCTLHPILKDVMDIYEKHLIGSLELITF